MFKKEIRFDFEGDFMPSLPGVICPARSSKSALVSEFYFNLTFPEGAEVFTEYCRSGERIMKRCARTPGEPDFSEIKDWSKYFDASRHAPEIGSSKGNPARDIKGKRPVPAEHGSVNNG